MSHGSTLLDSIRGLGDDGYFEVEHILFSLVVFRFDRMSLVFTDVFHILR